MKIKSTILILACLLVGLLNGWAQTPVINRALPVQNVNNVAGADRCNVQWTDSELPAFYGDDFTLPAGTWVIDKLVVWGTAGLTTDASFVLADYFDQITLYTGAATGSTWAHGTTNEDVVISSSMVGTFTTGNLTDNTNITITNVSYYNNEQYQNANGTYRYIYKIEFDNLNWIVKGGQRMVYGVNCLYDGNNQTPTYRWFNLFSNAAKSGATADQSDGFMIYFDLESPIGIRDLEWLDPQTGNWWDKNNDAHLEVYADRTNLFVDDEYNSSTIGWGINKFASIQNAIDGSIAGDVIEVAAGTYDLTETIVVNKALTISGPLSGSAIVRGTNTNVVSVFEIAASNVTIQNLEITHNNLAAGLPNPWAELPNSLIRVPVQTPVLSSISILNNKIYVPAQTGPMSTWNGVAITVGSTSANAVTITGNTIYNTRNGVIIHYNNTAIISNNIIYDTKGGIMNYTGSQADADNRTMNNNTWSTTHNEWDIVWNSGGGPYQPDYNQSVLVLSGVNNDAYVLSLMTTIPNASTDLTGNRSHVFVNVTTGTLTKKWSNGNINLPYQTIALGNEAVVPGGKVIVAAGTYEFTAQMNLDKNISIIGQGNVIFQANNASWSTVNGYKHLIGIYAGDEANPVTITNVTMNCNSQCFGLNTYSNANGILNGVTINGSKGAGLTVNGSTISATNLNTSANAWGAVNVDPGSGVTTPSVFTLSGGTLAENSQIWSDGDYATGQATVTVNAIGYNKYNVGTTKIWTNRALTNCATITKGGETTIYSTIQAAINAADAGDVITVAAGTYNENLIVSKSLILKGANADVAFVGRGAESKIIPTANGFIPVTIASDGVTFNGFELSAPGSPYALSSGGTGRSNLLVTYNNIHDVGTTYTGNVHSIQYNVANGSSTNGVTISHNKFDNINNVNNTASGTAIGILQSTSTGTITNLLIENNSISNVNSKTATTGGKGAYGIIINVGSTGGGSAINPIIRNNSISDLSGKWAHAIGLEGNTPGALVSNNIIDQLSSNPSPGDACGVMVETNTGVSTVSINNNKFTNLSYGVISSVASFVNATCNWYGSAIAADVAAKNYGNVNYLPFSTLENPTNCLGLGPVVNTTQNLSYMTIQAAINAGIAGDVIEVAAGTYVESGQIVISKNLTIMGADKATTIIKPAQGTGGSGYIEDNTSWILVNSGVTFNLSNVTLDGTGKTIVNAILSHGHGTIDNNIIKNMQQLSSYDGVGVALLGSDMTVSNNTFSGIGREGVWAVFFSNATITGNTYTGKGNGDWLDYAVEVGRNSTATISGNTFTACTGVASYDGSTSAGIMATSYYDVTGTHTNATITGNTITGNFQGITVGYDANDVSNVTATNNDLSGNTGAAIITTSAPVSAPCNWWGTADPSVISTKVSGDVNYIPFEISDGGDCTGGPIVVFQSDGTTFVSSHETIQAAITAASAGYVISVPAGTYVESGQIVINKDLTIIGADKATTIIKTNQSTAGSGDGRGWFIVNAGITFNLSNVTLDGEGFNVAQGIRSLGTTYVDNCNFNRIAYPGYLGMAVALIGSGEVKNSAFNNIGRIGIISGGNNTTTVNIEGNTYTGNGIGDHLDYAIVINAGATGTITGNTITACKGQTPKPGSWTSTAIMITTGYGAGTTATITGNSIDDCTFGISAGGNSTYGQPTVAAHLNKFTGITYTYPEPYESYPAHAIEASAGMSIDATCNWFGTADYNVVLTKIEGDVDVVNYLVTDDIVNPVCTGGVWPVQNITQNIYYQTIQAAITAAAAGNVIEIAAGTYNYLSEGSPAPSGLIKVTKGVTLKAAAGARPIIDASGFDGVFKIHPSALLPGNTVIIEGFEIIGNEATGIAMTMQGCFNVTPAKVIIRDNWFHGMVGGIDFWGASSYLPIGWTSALANIEITNNKFYDMVTSGANQGFGAMIEDPANWTTAGNDYAVEIVGNEFSNLPSNGANPGVGIVIPRANDTWEAANVFVSENTFNNTVAVGVAIMDGDVTKALVEHNSLGCSLYGVMAAGIDNGPVSATCNWFGTADGDVIALKINGNVDYNPWLVTGTDNSTDPGFQPVPESCSGTIPEITATPVHKHCGDPYGAIQVENMTGGTPPYTIYYCTGSMALGYYPGYFPFNINSLPIGTCNIYITDANGTSSAVLPLTIEYLPVTKTTTANAKTYYATIQAAINAAGEGDVIDVCTGTYNEALTVNTANLTIQGAGPASTFITTTGSTPGITIAANGATIKNLGITNATQVVEGIRVAGATSGLTLDYVNFTNLGNNPGPGNAYGIQIMNSFSNLTVSNSEFIATNLGSYSRVLGIYAPANYTYSTFQIDHSTFEYFFTGIDIRSEIDGLTATYNTFGPQEIQDCQAAAAGIYFGDGPVGLFDINNINITNNTFTSYARGIYFWDYRPGEKIKKVDIKDNTFTNSIYSSGIRLMANDLNGTSGSAILEGPIAIDNNTFSQDSPIVNGNGVAMIDLRVGAESATSQIDITNNDITFTGSFTLSTWGMVFRGPIHSMNITGNTLNGNDAGGASSNMPATSGIVFQSDYSGYGPMSSTADFNITGNTINEFTNGIAVYNFVTNTYGGIPAGASVAVNDNIIQNNIKGIYSGTGEVADATNNYWGSVSGPYHATNNTCGTGNSVSDYVSFAPFWINEGMTTPGTPPVHNVTMGTYFCGIQQAITAATAGDMIEVAAGTYAEAVNITKQLTLNGANQGKTGYDVARGSESIVTGLVTITPAGSGSTINGFEFDPVSGGAVYGNSCGNITFTNNRILGAGLTGANGINLTSSAPAQGSSITNNYITSASLGISVDHDGLTFVISGNYLDGNRKAITAGSGSSAQVTGNTILNSTQIGVEIFKTSGSFVNNNSFVDNAVAVANPGTTGTLDATCNWFGTANSNTIATKISGDVTYSPWLISEGGACAGTPVVVSLNTLTPESCPNTSNGSIKINIDGGAYPYQIAWTGGSSGSATTSLGAYTVSNLAPGEYTITVTDLNGSTDELVEVITTTNTAPALTNPGNQTVNIVTGCSAVADYTVTPSGTPPFTTTYVFAGATTGSGSGTGTGSSFNKGTTHVTVTTLNFCSSATASFDVIVEDHIAPTISCVGNQDRATNLNNATTYTVQGTEFNPTAFDDNCTGSTIAYVLSGVTTGAGSSLAGVALNSGITTVTWTVTDASLNTNSCSFTVEVTSTYTISGTIKYANNAQTPLNGIIVTLKSGGVPVGTWNTSTPGQSGIYQFAGLASGTYDIELSSTNAGGTFTSWGGVNATDYLLEQRHANNTSPLPLTPAVKRIAGDVKAPATPPAIILVDANAVRTAYITKNPAGLENPRWVFSKSDAVSPLTGLTNIAVTGNVTLNIVGACAGDVDASFLPPNGNKSVQLPNVEVFSRGNIAMSQEIALPVRAENDMQMGAISLILDFDASKFEITGVSMPDYATDAPFFVTDNNMLRIGWASLEPVNVLQGETVLTIHARPTGTASESLQFTLNSDPLSEIADAEGVVLKDARLSIAEMNGATSSDMISVYPNPAKEVINIEYVMDNDGTFSAELYNAHGAVVCSATSSNKTAGTHKETLNISHLSPGVFTLRVYNGSNVTNHKVIIN